MLLKSKAVTKLMLQQDSSSKTTSTGHSSGRCLCCWIDNVGGSSGQTAMTKCGVCLSGRCIGLLDSSFFGQGGRFISADCTNGGTKFAILPYWEQDALIFQVMNIGYHCMKTPIMVKINTMADDSQTNPCRYHFYCLHKWEMLLSFD